MGRPLGVAWLLTAEVPFAGRATITVGGRAAHCERPGHCGRMYYSVLRSMRADIRLLVAGRPERTHRGFGYSEWTCHTLGTPHLLGADVPPLGAISLTQSGRTAIGDCQYIPRMLRADVPPLGAAVVAQSGRTATGDYQYVSRVLGTDVPPLGVVLVSQRLRADVPPLVRVLGAVMPLGAIAGSIVRLT
jgi:hypothetical protein